MGNLWAHEFVNIMAEVVSYVIDSEVEEILGKTRGGSEGKERKLWSGSGFVNKN